MGFLHPFMRDEFTPLHQTKFWMYESLTANISSAIKWLLRNKLTVRKRHFLYHQPRNLISISWHLSGCGPSIRYEICTPSIVPVDSTLINFNFPLPRCSSVFVRFLLYCHIGAISGSTTNTIHLSHLVAGWSCLCYRLRRFCQLLGFTVPHKTRPGSPTNRLLQVRLFPFSIPNIWTYGSQDL